MDLTNQILPLAKLQKLHETNHHSILLQGASGSGKTYLAKQFSDMKSEQYGYAQFHVVQPKVLDLKEMIESSLQLDDIQVLCVENLDQGVNAASQVILKYLEEPLSNMYIVITCANSAKLPSTIRSRAIQIDIPSPTKIDLENYTKAKNARFYEISKDYSAFKCCKSYSDLNEIMKLSISELQYYDDIKAAEFWKEPVDQIVWGLTHYLDNSKSDIVLALKVLWKSNLNSLIRSNALSALRHLETGRLSESAVINNFVINSKL